MTPTPPPERDAPEPPPGDALVGGFRPGVTYLDTASMGLPPSCVLAAVRGALDDWEAGRSAAGDFDEPIARSRRLFGELVGLDPDRVAIGPQASVFVGLVAASLPPGSEVLLASGDFTSVMWPFLAQQARGVRVREAPLGDLPGEVRPGTTVVAVSAAQSADGALVDLDALRDAAASAGAHILLDTTQSAGWLPLDLSGITWTVTGGYKWLLAPRGTCLFTATGEGADMLVPHLANWHAAGDPWQSIYGSPMRLADDARRFDISPAWQAWAGQAAALEFLLDVGVQRIHDHDLAVANRFREAIGMPPGDSAIVSVAVDDGAAAALAAARVRASMRAGRLRLAFHLHNGPADADLAADVLAGHLGGDHGRR